MNNFLLNNIIAHRGVHNDRTIENTLEAFKKAIIKNYIIELDVHLLKDGEVVVYHDNSLKRLNGINKKIKSYDYAALKEINFMDNKKAYIPTLKEVLSLVDGKVPLLIEIKSSNKVGLLENELMNILKKYKGEYAIQSFNPKTLLWFKKNYPIVLRGQIVSSFKNSNKNKIEKFLLRKMFFNFLTKPNFISYNINDLNDNKIKKIKKKYILIGWLVSSRKEYNKLKDKYNNLVCDTFI